MTPNNQNVISDLRIAVICSSNMNRSMEAHAFLAKKGFIVKSYGTGDKVKLPGSAADKPNIYEFGTSYEEIYQDLLNKDKSLYVTVAHSKIEFFKTCIAGIHKMVCCTL